LNEDFLEKIKALNATAKGTREVAGLDFTFDPMRYAAWKLRSGEAIPTRGGFYQPFAPGAVWVYTALIPEGYVQIMFRQRVTVSQNGVIEMMVYIDTPTLPWTHIPRLYSEEFHWAKTLPLGLVVKDYSVITYGNHDAAPQWLSSEYTGMFLRRDVWEKDARLMDLAATKYSTPPEVMTHG